MDPIHIPVSEFQRRRLAQIADEITHLQSLTNESVTAIVASAVDPASLAGWRFELVGQEIVCTPPADAPNAAITAGPSLVA